MRITIDNPETKNGLTWEGTEQLARAFEELQANDSIKVAVVTGNDQYFYTGGRVDPSVPGEQEKYAAAIAHYDSASRANKKPLISAVSGHCLKAGMGMIAKSDFAIACPDVEFGYPEVRMGGVPMVVLVDTVDTMPRKRMLEALLTSWNFSAQDAYMMGLINRIVPREKFDEEVEKYVRVFLDTPPELIEMTKRAYDELLKRQNKDDRADFANRMLKEEVLPMMEKVKTQYNV